MFNESVKVVIDLAIPCVNAHAVPWEGHLGLDLALVVCTDQLDDQVSWCLFKLCGLHHTRLCLTAVAAIARKDDTFFMVVDTCLKRSRLGAMRELKVEGTQEAGRFVCMPTCWALVLWQILAIQQLKVRGVTCL